MRAPLAPFLPLLLAAAGIAQDGTPPAVRNVVFFLVDDLGWADVSPNNPETFYETPNIQRLADSAANFTQAYAASPVCSPTRASILTGRNPARTHTTQWFGGPQPERARNTPRWNRRPLLPAAYVDELPLAETTLAEALAEGGWLNWFGGKWHLGRRGHWPTDQGFAINRGGYHRGNPGDYWSPYGFPTLDDGPEGEYLTTRLANEAEQFLAGVAARHAAARPPFLLYFSFYNVHTPLQGEPEVVARFRAKRQRLPEQEIWGREGDRKLRLVQEHAVYAAMVDAMDRAVGRVLDALDRHGFADDTLVVFFSDNGGLSTSEGHPTSNLPLRGGKGWLYEGGIREPCFVRWPGVTRPGSVIETPVVSMDFYPTVLEATGQPLRPAQHIDGRSLAPLLRGAAPPGERSLYWHYPHYSNQGGGMGGAIRRGRWKLIEHFADDSVELYDLQRDIGEQRDLASAHPVLAASLRAELHGWRAGIDARLPTANR